MPRAIISADSGGIERDRPQNHPLLPQGGFVDTGDVDREAVTAYIANGGDVGVP